VGFCTIYGDQAGGLSQLSDLYKGEVWELSRWYNKHHKKELIPVEIIDKQPSAELAPNQKDSDSLPPYDILDAILKLYIERDLLNKKDIDKNEKMLYNVPKSEILRVIKMVDRAEFKRRQAPPTIRIHKRAFGSGRRLPIVQKFERR
jgi:NAD+ synthetase